MEEINRPENIKHPLEKLGNFWMFFDDSNSILAEIKHKNPVYVRFNAEYPELCAELHRKISETKELRKRLGAKASLKGLEKELSNAFDIMKGYVEDENTLL